MLLNQELKENVCISKSPICPYFEFRLVPVLYVQVVLNFLFATLVVKKKRVKNIKSWDKLMHLGGLYKSYYLSTLCCLPRG